MHDPSEPIPQQSAGHDAGASPISQNPLPQTGAHVIPLPLWINAQQSEGHDAWSSPVSQNPFPHAADPTPEPLPS